MLTVIQEIQEINVYLIGTNDLNYLYLSFFFIISLRPLFPGSNEVDQIAKIHDVLGTPSLSILRKLQK